MKTKYLSIAFVAGLLSLGSCNGFLDTKPDTLLTQDQTFGDPVLIQSVVANFYGRITFGTRIDDWDAWTMMDEVVHYDNNSDENIDRNKWRPYDYVLIHDLNQFLVGIKASSAIDDATRQAYIDEVRFIRAWSYFCFARTLGGVPLLGDQVFTYQPGMDITTLQIQRATEAGIYDYVISECQEITKTMGKSTNIHSARANYWVAKMLEARAAITAGDLAKYNTVAAHPQLRTTGGEVGIPVDKAQSYFQTALAAAEDVIANSPYELMTSSDKTHDALANNFYKAVCQKDGNTEVIWSRDYYSPGQTHQFTKSNLPKSIEQDTGSDRLSVLLGLVESFEPINAPEAERGMAKQFETGTLTNPVFYDNPTDLFRTRDARLMGSIIVPGSSFDSKEVVLQAGQLHKDGTGWKEFTGQRNSTDDQGRIITALNGPFGGNQREINRTGFYVRKYLDATPSAGTIGRGSEMWNVYFRIAEAYLIAAEAQWQISQNATDAKALGYINIVRDRAGIQPLTSLDLDKIIHENRVEFAFEGHRWWQLKRWMKANELWTGSEQDRSAQRLGLWPYKVVQDGDVNNGKWVFIEKNLQTLDLWRRPLKCTDTQYYGEISSDWRNKNPKLVKNPYQ